MILTFPTKPLRVTELRCSIMCSVKGLLNQFLMPHQRRTGSRSRAGRKILPAGVEIFRTVPFTLYRLRKSGNTFASINGEVIRQNTQEHLQHQPGIVDGNGAWNAVRDSGKGRLHSRTCADDIVDKERPETRRQFRLEPEVHRGNIRKGRAGLLEKVEGFVSAAGQGVADGESCESRELVAEKESVRGDAQMGGDRNQDSVSGEADAFCQFACCLPEAWEA